MMPQPIFDAVKKIKGRKKAYVILTCPTGNKLTQAKLHKLKKEKNIIIICGHYEGVDERVREKLAQFPGKTPVYLRLNTQNYKSVQILVGEDLFVAPNESLMEELRELIGEDKFSVTI